MLFQETGHALVNGESLVAFIPRYKEGGLCGCHRDDEEDMTNDWIISISFGATATFSISANGKELSVVAMSRMLWHQVSPVVAGTRWNLTFRCWRNSGKEPVLNRKLIVETRPPEIGCQFLRSSLVIGTA